MRKNVNKIICILLLTLPLALAAQTENDVWNHPLNAETRPRFNRVCETMTRHKVIKGTFVQTKSLNRLGRSLVSRGNFAVDAGRGIIWDTKTPFPSIIAVGRDFIVQNSNGRTTRMDASENETFARISQTMSSIFTGDSKTLTGAFEVYFTENGGTWNLGLLPKDSSVKAFVKTITIRGDSVLREVFFHEQSGDTIRYELSGHSYPAELSADEKALFTR